MSELIIVVAVAFLFYLLFRTISKHNERKLPLVSDDVFVEEFKNQYGVDDYEEIVKERENLAKYFNIDRQRIGININVNDFAKSFGTTGGYVAVNDIIYDLYDLNCSDSVKDIELPETAGGLINLFLSLKADK